MRGMEPCLTSSEREELQVQFVVFALSWMLVRIRGERGQDMMEYALLSGLLAAALLVIFAVGLNTGITDMAQGIAWCLDFNKGTTCNPPG